MNKIIKNYTKDDSTSESSFIFNSDIHSDIDIKKKYNMEIFNNNQKKLLTSKITDSSSESSRINFDTLEFESMKSDYMKTSYYTVEIINNMKFHTIYNILITSSYLIFVDNDKLIKTKKKLLFNCFSNKNSLTEIDFPGCVFLPYEVIDIIKKNIHILNNNLLNAEYESMKVYKNDDLCYRIIFEDGIINKNCIYKRMDIIDMMMFIPIEKYNIKQTEYKIRGFCQIVEELGAKTIDIKFKKNNINQNIKNYDIHMNNAMTMIAGNLGFSILSTNINEEITTFTLSFPINNTIILNENIIKNKIKKKNFIISESSYNSNLELQYLVNSRCKHMIYKYSTVFTFDNNNKIDESIYAQMKSHGIDIGFDIFKYNMNQNYMSIITDVIFSSMNDYKNIINGTNVSMDSIGFNFLIDSLKHSTDFQTNGIYKIIVFINLYIEKKIKNNMTKQYKNISIIMRKIKKEVTLVEYAELLCNYFTVDSQWIHFINYIDLLSNKTQSYDKLGYIIIICNNNILFEDKIEIMLRFIQQKCIERKIEDNFWHMIKPYNIRLKNELKNKLLYEYDFIQYYNWYNLNMLIQCIELYTINFNNMDNNLILLKLIQNMNVGYKYWEFQNNIIPFIIRHAHSINKDEIILSHLFEKNINIDSFINAKINNIGDLTIYIEKKVMKIKKGMEWVNSLTLPINIEQLYDVINSNEFIEKYDYINRRIHIIIGKKTKENLYDLLDNDTMNSNNSNNMNHVSYGYNLIKCIFYYNEKININTIPCNYLGFDIVYNNYINGIKKIVFDKYIIPFVINHIKDKSSVKIILQDFTIEKFNKGGSSYYNMINLIRDIMIVYNIDTTDIINNYFV